MATSQEASDKENFSKFPEQMDWLDDPEEKRFESRLDVIKYKIKQNPLVPIGCIATATVLGLGFANFLKGGSQKKSQMFMRWRVILQGATISFLALGMMYEQYKRPNKNTT